MDYYLINNGSRAASYGIGTYVRELASMLSGIKGLNLKIVELNAGVQQVTTIVESDCTRICIPSPHTSISPGRYSRLVWCILSHQIDGAQPAIFHFNYFQHYPLALLIKASDPRHRIVLTIHYFDWCFELDGNVSRFRAICHGKGRDEMRASVTASYEEELRMLRLSDDVIALSAFAVDILKTDYLRDCRKVMLIPNGLPDFSAVEADVFQQALRSRESAQSATFLFLGRLDDIKGVDSLIKAFHQVRTLHPDSRLLLAGDGDYNKRMAVSKRDWENIYFLGKVKRDELPALFSAATIAVLPSRHEQCSYSAVEFMKWGLPLIGTTSTGLGEMLDVAPECRVTIAEDRLDEDAFVEALSRTMLRLTEDRQLREKAAGKMRSLFLETYEAALMKKAYHHLLLDRETPGLLHDSEMLAELDAFMTGLIHKQEDLELDMSGLAGIGTYLWWRIESLRDNPAHEVERYRLEEYLIYYLDWLAEALAAENESQCCPELGWCLARMMRTGFYPFRVQRLVQRLGGLPNAEKYSPTDPSLLIGNALKMLTSTI